MLFIKIGLVGLVFLYIDFPWKTEKEFFETRNK